MAESFMLTDLGGFFLHFESVEKLLERIKKEVIFWKETQERLKKEQGVDLCKPLLDSFARLDAAYHAITGISAVENYNYGTLRVNTKQIKMILDGLEHEWLFHDNMFTERVLQVNRNEGAEVAKGFLDYVVGGGVVLSSSTFKGALMAYEHEVPESPFIKRIERSRENLDTLVGDVYKRVGEVHTLRNAYEKQLQLSTPAKYWRSRALKNMIAGLFFVSLMLCVSGAAIWLFYEMFHGWLSIGEQQIRINTAQGIALIIVLIAVVTFVLRILSKLALSSFHIMHDSSERRYLTLFYISMLKEDKMDDAWDL